MRGKDHVCLTDQDWPNLYAIYFVRELTEQKKPQISQCVVES